ncbi:hypothetical protein QTO30_20865 [Yoonia sp. GPGPB17]|uniref:hypothetical protein n=1 Tax=Yoonia sp. GPGPB17 TaxID=3026147 RepID=UPI0030C2CC6B
MLDGLTIWLAMVGVATIAMFTFDGLCWVWRKLSKEFRRFGFVHDAGRSKAHSNKNFSSSKEHIE